MGWIQLQVRTNPEQAQELEEQLCEQGALAITLLDAADQPMLEPARGETPLWNDITLKALFPAGQDPRELIQQIQKSYLPKRFPPLDFNLLDEQPWERAWMDKFKPIIFKQRLRIYPSWSDSQDEDGIVMKLDPGLAFGTGTHPTTALCLEWLDEHDLKANTVIDYGCGSGILGIAALLLGADSVIGVDNDPQALLASRDNCEKNQIAPERFPVLLPADCVESVKRGDIGQQNLLLANILAGPLITLAGYLSALVMPGGHILLSGILEEQAQAVMDAYQDYFDLDPPAVKNGWVRISGQRLK